MNSQKPYERWRASLTYEEFVKNTYEALVDQKIGVVEGSRKYLGKKSGHAHQIDVSIEFNIADLSLLILFECKHYKNRVAIGDILEFAQRIDDIGAQKGVVVTTVGFQEGAVKVADGYGIALVITAPVWQIIHHCVNEKSEVAGVYLGGLEVSSYGDRFAGVTVSLENAGIREEPYTSNAWQAILEFLQCDIKCRGCGQIVKTIRNGQCVSLPRHLCFTCFIASQGMECPECGECITKITRGICSKCGDNIILNRFKDTSWYKCNCGKMINVSDVKRYTAQCGCGHILGEKKMQENYWRCA